MIRTETASISWGLLKESAIAPGLPRSMRANLHAAINRGEDMNDTLGRGWRKDPKRWASRPQPQPAAQTAQGPSKPGFSMPNVSSHHLGAGIAGIAMGGLGLHLGAGLGAASAVGAGSAFLAHEGLRRIGWGGHKEEETAEGAAGAPGEKGKKKDEAKAEKGGKGWNANKYLTKTFVTPSNLKTLGGTLGGAALGGGLGLLAGPVPGFAGLMMGAHHGYNTARPRTMGENIAHGIQTVAPHLENAGNAYLKFLAQKHQLPSHGGGGPVPGF